MTTYTTPHGMPILESTDKIAATDDGLRQDINAVSLAADTAITAEGVRAESASKTYVDNHPGIPKVVTLSSEWEWEHVDQSTGKRIEGRRWNGTRYFGAIETPNLINTSQKTVYVLPVLGQSNALYKWHDATRPKVRELNPDVLVWNATEGTAAVAALTHGESIGLNFALEFVRRFPGTQVVIVPCAVGSSGFTPNANGTWDPDSAALPNLFNNAVTSITACLAATGGTILAALWSQGENDRSTMTEIQWAAAFDNLVAKLKTALGLAVIKFILGSMTPEETAAGGANAARIAAAIIDTPRRLTNTAYVGGPANSTLYGERIHYTAEGNAVRGALMATEGLYRAALNVSGSLPQTPRGLRIQRSGTTAEIQWDAPPCRFTKFILETSTDYGASWALVTTLAGPVVLSHSMTGLTAADPLWARITTENETGLSLTSQEAKA